MRILTNTFFCAILLATLCVTTPCFAAQKLYFSGIDSIHSKIALHVLREAYAQLGIEIEHKPYPILRSVKAAESGAVDGQLMKVEGLEAEHPELVMVPVPVNHVELMVIALKNSSISPDWQELKNYQVGIYRGVFFLKRETMRRGIKSHEISTNQQLLKMIELGRIDAAIFARIAGLLVMNELNSTNIEMIKPPLHTINVYHYLNKKHLELVPRINAILEKMQQSGRTSEIRRMVIQEELGELYNSF